MSTQAYRDKSKEFFSEPALPCLGLCGLDYESAFARLTNEHPEWTRVRRKQRAWVEMFKREAA